MADEKGRSRPGLAQIARQIEEERRSRPELPHIEHQVTEEYVLHGISHLLKETGHVLTSFLRKPYPGTVLLRPKSALLWRGAGALGKMGRLLGSKVVGIGLDVLQHTNDDWGMSWEEQDKWRWASEEEQALLEKDRLIREQERKRRFDPPPLVEQGIAYKSGVVFFPKSRQFVLPPVVVTHHGQKLQEKRKRMEQQKQEQQRQQKQEQQRLQRERLERQRQEQEQQMRQRQRLEWQRQQQQMRLQRLNRERQEQEILERRRLEQQRQQREKQERVRHTERSRPPQLLPFGGRPFRGGRAIPGIGPVIGPVHPQPIRQPPIPGGFGSNQPLQIHGLSGTAQVCAWNNAGTKKCGAPFNVHKK